MNELRGTQWAIGDILSRAEPHGVDACEIVELSGLFDAAWYCAANKDIAACGLEPFAHFMEFGWREGRDPNPYFHTRFYLQQNIEVAHSGINPLVDYILRGEAAGCAPAPWFDLFWYRTQHQVGRRQLALRHFLTRRFTGTVSPLPEFDPRYYLTTYADIVTARADPFDHFLHWGYREFRNPNADFDTRFYIQRHLGNDFSRNPLLHYRQLRHVTCLPTQPPPTERAVFDEVRRFTRPGPMFERFTKLPRGAARHARVLAYYLPQFHAVAENDAWWGDGFTEWTALNRGQPRFLDHYQPRTPRDLGHYSLDDPATLRRQVTMARDAGLFGFVMYFYWFNGRRLLERPLEAFLADKSIDFPFCLMWANENWTRRWDGSDNEVLISQDYRVEDDAALIDCYARHFRDPRYIRAEGRPLLIIYRPRLIPNTRATIARWREMFAERHGEMPLLVMAQSFGDTDPRVFDLDGAIEFPPHKLATGLDQCNKALTQLDANAHAQVFAYDDLAAASLAEAAPPFPLIKTAVPSWDNDARRQGNGLAVHGSTPARYEAWLAALVDRAAEHPFFGERFVCVNAWNEWAEGAYLEPDVYFGAAYTNATGRAVARLAPMSAAGRVLLVGHDAFPAGAQHLLLNLGARLRRRFGVQVEFLLLGGGDMLGDYEQVAPTVVAADAAATHAALADAGSRGFAAAIVNTSAAAWAGPFAAQQGFSVTLLVHELPQTLRARSLIDSAAACAGVARRVVFPVRSVADGFIAHVAVPHTAIRVLPQGCYRPVIFDPAARARRRERLGVREDSRIVLGVGTGDLRKGFDLFVQAWRAARRDAPDIVFCWLGRIDPVLRGWLAPEIDAAEATGTFHAPGFTRDLTDWFSAADVFALTSREDPFPTVVLEALSAGLPVIAFAGSGGAADLISEQGSGAVVAMGDAAALARALLTCDLVVDRGPCAAAIARDFAFDAYASALLAEAQPDLPTISVAVTSRDYAQYMTGRLGSIFAQTLPVVDIRVLDDASSDASVAVARDAAADWRRDIDIVVRDGASGSPFGQWRAAAEQARGDFLWIAEADDEAEPQFLAHVADAIRRNDDVVLVACDSRSIDAAGAPIWPDYRAYYAESGAADLARSLVMPARGFARRFLSERNLLLNVSGVVWRRAALLAALSRCEAELPKLARGRRLARLSGTARRRGWPGRLDRRAAECASSPRPKRHCDDDGARPRAGGRSHARDTARAAGPRCAGRRAPGGDSRACQPTPPPG